MLFIKKLIISLFVLINAGCATNNITKISPINLKAISVDTPNDKYNILFKKYLKRKFNNEKKLNPDYILEAKISFNSNQTLSVSGSKVLNSTKAVINYSLIENNSDILVKYGSINTFPALSSSSNSLYSNETSLRHIKERLSHSSANKLYILIKMILSKLN